MRGDVLFRVVAIPAGEHDVEFRFAPPSVRLGLAISVGALALLLIGLVSATSGGSGRRRRTTSG
jgi:uncharacterized membrane protein YfhO